MKRVIGYNFTKRAWISEQLYNEIWACGDLWSNENINLLDELCSEVNEDVFEINCSH